MGIDNLIQRSLSIDPMGYAPWCWNITNKTAQQKSPIYDLVFIPAPWVAYGNGLSNILVNIPDHGYSLLVESPDGYVPIVMLSLQIFQIL